MLGVGMIVAVVVCIGFLVFLIVLGIYRIRSVQLKTKVVQVDEKQEMEWDNSALNIIVNPMEQEVMYEDEHEITGQAPDTESESDGDASSYQEELDSEAESEQEKSRAKTNARGDLEWDDSTLTY